MRFCRSSFRVEESLHHVGQGLGFVGLGGFKKVETIGP